MRHWITSFRLLTMEANLCGAGRFAKTTRRHSSVGTATAGEADALSANRGVNTGREHDPEKLQDFSDKIMRPRKDLEQKDLEQKDLEQKRT
jgi:hypothetical protein